MAEAATKTETRPKGSAINGAGIDDVSYHLGRISTKIDEQSNRADERHNELSGRIDDLSKEMKERFKEADERMTKIEVNIARIYTILFVCAGIISLLILPIAGWALMELTKLV